MIPPLSNEFIALLKDTALVSTIALPEIFFVGREVMSKEFNVTPLMGVAMFYLLLTIPPMRLVQNMCNIGVRSLCCILTGVHPRRTGMQQSDLTPI